MTHILGLTGSIGTGKSTVSTIFKRLHLPIFDADDVVNAIYETDQHFFRAVQETYPDYIINNTIDKKTISHQAFHHKELLIWLQTYLHQQVRQASHQFIDYQRKHHVPLAILTVPLLFETDFHTLCDSILVTICDEVLQQQRVLGRPGMTLEKYQAIIGHQWSQAKKAAHATWTLSTNGSLLSVIHQLRHLRKACQ